MKSKTVHSRNRTLAFRAGPPLAIALLAIAVFALLACPAPQALAYYELDPVSIDLASSSISVAQGGSKSVSCPVTPATERQLPGCGMETCPQGCGDGCLNDKGWCTCAGTTYETMTTTVSASSGSANIATASWSKGVLVVKGYAMGTTTVTLTAKLSKHRDATKSIQVTVTAPTNSGMSGTKGASGAKKASEAGKPGSPGSGASRARNSSNGRSAKRSSRGAGTTGSGGVSASSVSNVGTSSIAEVTVGTGSSKRPAGSEKTETAANAEASEPENADRDSASGIGGDAYLTRTSAGVGTTLGTAASSALSQFDLTSPEALERIAARGPVMAPLAVAGILLLATIGALLGGPALRRHTATNAENRQLGKSRKTRVPREKGRK